MKRYVVEAGSTRVRALMADHPVATCRLSEVEVASALSRRLREGVLSRSETDRALAALRIDIGSIAVVELTEQIVRAAVGLLARHALRTGDSVQLASCLHLRSRLEEDVMLIAYDARLNDAARAEGLALVAGRSPGSR